MNEKNCKLPRRTGGGGGGELFCLFWVSAVVFCLFCLGFLFLFVISVIGCILYYHSKSLHFDFASDTSSCTDLLVTFPFRVDFKHMRSIYKAQRSIYIINYIKFSETFPTN